MTLGDRTANTSVAEQRMLPGVGLTVREGHEPVVLRRDAISLQIPDGKTLPLATHPRDVIRRCTLSFFPDTDRRSLS